ncbi:MAG: PadR family transcriptional regulator [Thermoleophilia bacterium]|nr:PadR family transcriptional regulator [Thermoleophilia bacterium]
MAIKYAILGLLSWKPSSGYQLRKYFSETVALYWSGNSNQVYPALVDMHKEGLVESETMQQGNYPPSKVYSLAPAGRAALREWVVSDPALPQMRNSFLTQLAWADQLTEAELESLIERYEHEVQLKLLMQKELVRRGPEGPARTPRAELLWFMIADHDRSMYEAELQWLARLREELTEGGDS